MGLAKVDNHLDWFA